MRMPTNYPALPNAKPINWKRWLQSLFVVVSIALLITNIFWPEEKTIKTPLFWLVSLIIPAISWAFVFSLFVLFNKLTLYNRAICLQVIEEDEKKWWQYYSASLPIEDVIIIGSLGNNQYNWKSLISNKQTAPFAEKINDIEVLRCPLLIGNQQQKEKMLSHLLVNELIMLDIFNHDTMTLNHIYWLGSEQSMNTFIDCLKENKISIPTNNSLISSISDLDIIIDNYHQTCLDNQYVLVAGNNLNDHPINGALAESGFVWRVSKNGQNQVYRCETVTIPDESVNQLTAQLIKSASINQPPSTVIAMDNNSPSVFIDSHWLATNNTLTAYYGAITPTSPFLAISQAAAHCIDTKTDSCGWILECNDNQYMAGVITQHEPK